MTKNVSIALPKRPIIQKRLEQILERGSVNLGEGAQIDRLMLMLTRSCELRCSYCMVRTTEDGRGTILDGTEVQTSKMRPPVGEMSQETMHKAVDFLMKSSRRKLELQFFGGEPTRRWDLISEAMDYAWNHPRRQDRFLEFHLTTNGLGLTAERIAALEQRPVMILFSLDGSAKDHNHYRRPLLVSPEDSWSGMEGAIERLKESKLKWFMNATLPPAAADQLEVRYQWARTHEIPELQLNYAMGMWWSLEQEAAYLRGLQRVLRHHASDPGGMRLYNWRSDAEPVMLSEDLIVDVDGTLYQDGAIFLERSLPELKGSHRRGHLDDGFTDFDTKRWTLRELHDQALSCYAPDSKKWAIIEQNIMLGTAVDFVIHYVRKDLNLN